MKGPLCIALCLFGLMALASAGAWFEGETCIDLTKAPACKNKPVGDHQICNFCEHGFFARCHEEHDEVSVIACPHVENDNGKFGRLIFDDVTKTCVEKTPTCNRRRENEEENWI